MKILKFIVIHYKNVFIFPFWFFLFCLSQIYKYIVIKKRKNGYKNKVSGVKIISIGNITLGGTGKTEFVMFLIKLLKSETGVVLRGYKKKNKSKAVEVLKDSSALLVGDEPLMIKQKTDVPVFVASSRIDGVKALKEKYRVKRIILDDGFQHFNIKRDINIVLIDYTNPFGNNHLIPAGFLREPVSSLKDADLAVITKYDEEYSVKHKKQDIENIIKKYNRKIKILYSRYIPDFNYKKFKNKKIIIFSALANNEYFLFLVKKYLEPIDLKIFTFPDHYLYNENDLKKIFRYFKSNNFNYIFTTEKDIVKIKNRKGINVFKIKFKLISGQEFLNF